MAYLSSISNTWRSPHKSGRVCRASNEDGDNLEDDEEVDEEEDVVLIFFSCERNVGGDGADDAEEERVGITSVVGESVSSWRHFSSLLERLVVFLFSSPRVVGMELLVDEKEFEECKMEEVEEIVAMGAIVAGCVGIAMGVVESRRVTSINSLR